MEPENSEERSERENELPSTPGENDEEKHPFEILPQEMWEEVFKYVTGADEILSLSNSHPSFKVILEQRLKDVVLITLLNNASFIKACQLSQVKICSLRGVCKNWKNVIDHHFDDLLLRKFQPTATTFAGEPLADLEYIREPITTKLAVSRWNITTMLMDFNPLVKTSAKNLVCRSLEIVFDEISYNSARFVLFVEQLLEIVGAQVWQFSMDVGSNSEGGFVPSAGRIYILLQKWARHIPNLRSLDVSVPNMTIALGEIDSIVFLHPFPRLEHLKRLSGTGLFSPILNRLLESNQGVNRLDRCPIERIQQGRHRFPSLRLEAIQLMSWYLYDVRNIDPTWPLKSLEVNFLPECPSTPSLFRILGKIETLEQVTLINLGGNEGSLNLPNLKRFKSVMNENFHRLDFLSACKNLELINLAIYDTKTCKMLYENDDKEMIKFKGYLDNMKESNIWLKFLNLKMLKVHHLNFMTRQGRKTIYKRPESKED